MEVYNILFKFELLICFEVLSESFYLTESIYIYIYTHTHFFLLIGFSFVVETGLALGSKHLVLISGPGT